MGVDSGNNGWKSLCGESVGDVGLELKDKVVRILSVDENALC